MKYTLLFACIAVAMISCASQETDKLQAEDQGSCRKELPMAEVGSMRSFPTQISKYEATLLMVFGFGGLSVVLALVYNAVRKHVFHDIHNLDTTFDAGGRVTVSLTSVAVLSHLLWPADFLQTTTIAMKTGLGGSLFFVISITIVILLFPILSIALKTKAPGAKTFLQIIYVRYGKPAHILYCCIAMLTNLITLTSMILSGKYALDVVTNDMPPSLIVIILAFLFGSYCFIGGLGTTFYIAYFNTALTFICLLVFAVKVKDTDNGEFNFTSIDSMYEAMKCVEGPDGNYDNSLLTFRSLSAVMYGLVLLLMAVSLTFCDQANWQSRIAAKPTQGVIGFYIAALLYFCIPASITLPSTLSYLSMSYQNGTHQLSSLDIDNGFITPLMMGKIMGRSGGYLLITMITMALMSTGSGEIMAISSIIVYDIYKVYIKPFRTLSSPTCCQLCGKDKVQYSSEDDQCSCVLALDCHSCSEDVKMINDVTAKSYGLIYTCPLHGAYRHYEDELIRYKNWCIIWVTIAVIPFGLFIIAVNINLFWAVFTLQALLSPFIIPLLLTLCWSKCTSQAVISGSLLGSIASFGGLLIVGATAHDTGLKDFFTNTSSDYSLLAACISGFAVSFLTTISVSLVTHKIKSPQDSDREWKKTFSIDNPLNSWRRLYIGRFEKGQVTQKDLEKSFRGAKRLAFIGGPIFVIILLAVIPPAVLQYKEFDKSQLSMWMQFFFVMLILGTVFVVIAPPVEEIYQILKFIRKNKQESKDNKEKDIYDIWKDNNSLIGQNREITVENVQKTS